MTGHVVAVLSVEQQVNCLLFFQIIISAEYSAQKFVILSVLLRNVQMISIRKALPVC